MLVHFMTDAFIIGQLMDNFEQANPNQNLFLIFREKSSSLEAYAKHAQHTKEFLYKTSNIKDIFDQLTDIKGIVLQSLSYEYAKALEQLKADYTIAWFAWGYDVYFLPKIKPHIYAKNTLEYLYSQEPALKWKWSILKNTFLRRVTYEPIRQILSQKLLDKARKKIKYFVSYVEGDFTLLEKNYPSNIQFYYFPYLSIFQYVPKELIDKRVSRNNIIIGNSGGVDGNHLDVLNILKQNQGRITRTPEIYLPLSYSGTKHYTDTIINKGKMIFGEGCIVVPNKMPLYDYVKMLFTCGVGIYYNFRQQAMGNIIAMLWLGARVYMSSKNPAYVFLISKGIIVFDLDKDFSTHGNKLLEDEFVERNKQILWSLFSPEVIEQAYKKLVLDIKK